MILCKLLSNTEIDSIVSGGICIKILCQNDDGDDINLNDVVITINDSIAFDSTCSFYCPWNGPNSIASESIEECCKVFNFIMDYSANPLESEKEIYMNVFIAKYFDIESAPIINGVSVRAIKKLDENYKLKVKRYDFGEPFLCELNPAPYQKNVDREIKTHVKLKILDENGSIHKELIHININDSVAFDGSVGFCYPWNGPESNIININQFYKDSICEGFFVVLDYVGEKFNLDDIITVHVVAADLYLNYLDTSYSFTTIEGPIISNMNLDGHTNVDPDAIIMFNVSDGYNGVDVDSIKVIINGQLALIGDIFISPFDGPDSSFLFDGNNGYNIVIDKVGKYKSRESVNIDIEVKDKCGNG